MKQTEIEYLIIEGKKCQGMIKEFDSEFEYSQYSKIVLSSCESIDAVTDYQAITDFAERTSTSSDEKKDYESLCGMVSRFKTRHHRKTTLEAIVDSREIIDSLKDMKEIADYRAQKWDGSSARKASEYISKVIQAGEECSGFFSRKIYSGTLGIDAIAADLFKGKLDKSYAVKKSEPAKENPTQAKSEPAKVYSSHAFENMPLYSSNSRPAEQKKRIPKPEKKERDPYEDVYAILRGGDKWVEAQHKKEYGNIFEKIFYSILYPGY
jgi:hypothetical protein